MSKAAKLLTFIFAAAFVCVASAGVSFAYQGVLRDGSGNATLGRNQSIQFRLYNNPTSDEMLWGRTVSVLLDSNGLFNVELSDSSGTELAVSVEGKALSEVKTLEEVLKDVENGVLYIGLSVVDGSGNSSGEIRPRQRILSVPYAAVARDVKTANGSLTVDDTLFATSVNVATNGTFTCNGAATFLKTMTVQGKATFKGNIEVQGSATVTGNISGTFVRNNIDIAPPVGMIVMWYGSSDNIPAGWALCDGTSREGRQTPDLRNRFIVGAGADYNLGTTGGAKEVTLSENQIPAHSHSTKFDSWGYVSGQKELKEALWNTVGDNGKFRVNISSGNTGGGKSHENRPPYYALFYIMRVK